MRRLSILFLLISVACAFPGVGAIAVAHSYATSSALAKGRWVKISVGHTGMQFISNSILGSIGFDKDKVRVFGYGGREIDGTSEKDIDDLSQIPIIKTGSGILFYGVDNISLRKATDNRIIYEHSRTRYADKSCYFLTDTESALQVVPIVKSKPAASGKEVSSFKEVILHESEMFMPVASGSLVVGEDFRVNHKQRFSFKILNPASPNATVTTSFAAATSNGSSSLFVNVNGQRLTSTTEDVIQAVNSVDRYIRVQKSIKSFAAKDGENTVEIEYVPGGVVKHARLDYIRIEYERKLQPGTAPLIFSTDGDAEVIRLMNCNSGYRVWDVTDAVTPLEITLEINGTDARFTPVVKGERKYIVFSADQEFYIPEIDGSIDNQDIHAMSIPEMLIIAPAAFLPAAEKLADLHRTHDNLTTVVLTPTQIYNEFSSGTPDIGAYRKLLRMWNEKSAGSFRYCLLFGKPTYNQRHIGTSPAITDNVLIWQSEDSETEAATFSTDDYIGIFSPISTSADMGSAKLSIGIGRLPASTIQQAEDAVEKIKNYITNADTDNRRSKVLVIADDQDYGVHLEQAENAIRNMQSSNGGFFDYERLYLDSFRRSMSATGSVYPDATERLLKVINDGVAYINYTGHGNAVSWGHEFLLSHSDIVTLENRYTPFIYASTCEFGRWDGDGLCGAEELWLKKNSGAIGLITASRNVFITPNGVLNAAISRKLFEKESNGFGKRIGDIYREGKNSTSKDENKLRYILMCDPALRLPNPTAAIVIDSINGNSVDDGGEATIVEAGQEIEVAGHVENAENALLSNFNGRIYASLFDAEKVMETLGNGDTGKKVMYADRRRPIDYAKANIENGYWRMKFLVPRTILNNYSPAMMLAYASNENGDEAIGGTEDFYIYGYPPIISDDFEGPEITNIYLNNPSFTNGGIVSPSPVLYADIADPSGINISSDDIGHQMMIRIDNSHVYTDVSDFFSRSDNDVYSGHLAYPLTGMEAGKHTLSLTAWDNMNNSTTITLDFIVDILLKPSLNIVPDHNPASTSVVFMIEHNNPGNNLVCGFDIYDISGRLIWRAAANSGELSSSEMSINWDLTDTDGNRVPRGIYIYKATLRNSSSGILTTSGKIAVTAQ